MVRYGSSLDFCINVEERELYLFLCSAKREGGSVWRKVAYLNLLGDRRLGDHIFPGTQFNNLFDVLYAELNWLYYELHSFAVVVKGRVPKLDKRRVARMLVLLWRLMGIEREDIKEDWEMEGQYHVVSEEMVQCREYLEKILKRIRRDGRVV